MKTSDQKFLDGIVDGKTVISAAKAAGISERTAYRKLASDEFNDALDAIRLAHTTTLASRASALARDSVNTIADLMQSSSDAIRLKASQLAYEIHRDVKTKPDAVGSRCP